MADNLFDKLRSMSGNSPEKLNILEEQVDVKLQMDYFKYSGGLKKRIGRDKLLEIEPVETMLSSELTNDELKENLALLASIDDPKAFRMIEQFVANKHDTLYEWSILALQESKMLLESSLLDENQVFISTGMGGKGNMLRYFVVLIGNNIEEFSEFQQGRIKSEFEFAIQEYKSELEELNFEHEIVTMKVLIPFDIPFQDLFKKAVEECNQYGNFLKSNFLVTNVKALSYIEIKEFINDNKLPDMGDLDFEIEDDADIDDYDEFDEEE